MNLAQVFEKAASGRSATAAGASLFTADTTDSALRGKRIEPATVELILAGAGLLLSLFGDDAKEEIGYWVREIEEQLEKTNRLLSQILDILSSLGVLLDQKFLTDAEADIHSRCSAYIDNLAFLRAAPDSPQAVALMNDYLREIQVATRKVMNYGYAGAFSVMYGMRAEADLLNWLRRGRDAKRAVYKRYNDYFSSCVNPHMPRSIPNRLPEVTAQMLPYENQYPPRDGQPSFFDPPRYWIEEIFHPGGVHHEDWIEKKKWREHYVASVRGSLAEGFRGSVSLGHIYTDSSRPDHEYRPNRELAFAEAQQQFASHLASLQGIAARYQILSRERRSLESASEACDKYREVAARLYEQATD